MVNDEKPINPLDGLDDYLLLPVAENGVYSCSVVAYLASQSNEMAEELYKTHEERNKLGYSLYKEKRHYVFIVAGDDNEREIDVNLFLSNAVRFFEANGNENAMYGIPLIYKDGEDYMGLYYSVLDDILPFVNVYIKANVYNS